jgi:hypothetical protein
VGGDVRNTLGTNEDLLDLAKLVLGFLIGDAVDSEATFNVIDETEVLTSLFNGNNICYYSMKKTWKKKHPDNRQSSRRQI